MDQLHISSASFLSRIAPAMVPTLTGIGALIAIGITICEIQEAPSLKNMAHMISHLFWLASGLTGSIYWWKKINETK